MVLCKCLRSYTCKNCPTTMKFILALSVVLTVSVALSSAACFRDRLRFNIKTRTAECVYKGKIHKVNTKWTEGCETCSCSQSIMECCSNIANPVGYDKEACISTFHEETCSYTVTKRDNPSEECKVGGWTG